MHRNTRDGRGNVINPRDHFVLPNAERLSRDDVRHILQSVEVWKHDPQFTAMNVLLPEMLSYLMAPPPGKPAISKEAKNHGLSAVSGESRAERFERARRTNSADRASRMNESRQFARSDRVNANRPGMYAVPYAPVPNVAIPHAATKRKNGSDHPANPAPFLRGNMVPNRPAVAPAPNVARPNAATKRKNGSDHPANPAPFLRGNMLPNRPPVKRKNDVPVPTIAAPFLRGNILPNRPEVVDEFGLPVPPAAQVNNARAPPPPPPPPRAPPPPVDEFGLPFAPAARAPPPPPPPPPIPPLNVPVRPVPPNDHRSPFRRLLDSAMRLGVQSAIGKLYALIGNDGVHTYTYQGIITTAGLTNDELVQLNEDTTGIALPTRESGSIMPNGVRRSASSW